MNFKELNLPKTIMDALENMNFNIPTPIQEKAIPIALQGKDVLGSAQTGTGKTAAFVIPMISHLLLNKRSTALIMLPTRELAVQVSEAANKMLGKAKDIKTALLIGGGSMMKQFRELGRKPRIIIGTPGRINDHLVRKTLKLENTDFMVLDETDRMLDMGFGIQIDEIEKYMPSERQTLMFSATLPNNIMSLSKKYLSNPVRIAIGEVNAVTQNVKQEILKTTDSTKFTDLVKQISERTGSHLVFVKSKALADRLSKKLNKENHTADAIHGDLRQSARDRVIREFRQQKYRVLVATDIAARGLDIPHIENVVNYDLPRNPEDYIHRIGRTARAGASGIAVSFVTPADRDKWKQICKLISPSNRDKQTLTDGFSPISAKPLASADKKAPKRDKKRNNTKFSAEASYVPASEKKSFRSDRKPAAAKFVSNDNVYTPADPYAEAEFGNRKPKAKTSSSNPFKPFAPDKKEVKSNRRAKFNKNSKTLGDFRSSTNFSRSSKSKSRGK